MATIRIAEDAYPPKRNVQLTRSDTQDTRRSRTRHDDAGIYNIRSRSRGHSQDPTRDDDPGLRKEGDFKEKQIFKGKMLLWLAYQSIGVIYGDIGTSPLYVYSSTFTSVPSHQDLIGVLSLILWSLFMMVTVKYVLIITSADNDGEGGTFSTYALLSRYMNITHRDPREASLVRMKRYASGDLENAGRVLRRGMESSRVARTLLKVVGVLAVSMVIADGVLTPAQSVLGAVQGAQVVNPNLSKGTIIGITDAILVLLFLVQPLGITKITVAFAPIIIIWLAFNAVFGIYNLVKFDASVFKAFNPGYAFDFLVRHGGDGWRMLGGVLLAFTGVEALFADLGAFSRRAIQLSWLCYTFPCLLLAYLGQAAYISVHPEAYTNPFFNAAPPGTVYPALIIAVLAAIVASQAIITATFQLLHQVMKLSYFPQLKVVHTSKIFHGQLYIPLANWLLMVGTILVASIYNNTTSLGNAYGVCVMFVTFFDSCMVSLTAIFVWRFSPFLVFGPWLVIACLDCTFLSSALIKVPHGAWFTIMLATILASIFLVWRFGKEQQWSAEAEDRFPTSHFVRTFDNHSMCLTEKYHGDPISHIKGFGIFFDKAGETTPTVFSQFTTKLTAAPEIMVFFHLRPLEVPSVPSGNRYSVSRLAIPNCYRLVVRYGFNDEVVTPDLAEIVYEQIRRYKIREHDKTTTSSVDTVKSTIRQDVDGEIDKHTLTPNDQTNDIENHNSITPDTDIDNNNNTITEKAASGQQSPTESSPAQIHPDLARLQAAYAHKVLYIIGKEQMRIRPRTGHTRRLLLSIFLWIRENTRTKMANLNVPIDRVIEVGFLKEI